jgi:hypothetical protein
LKYPKKKKKKEEEKEVAGCRIIGKGGGDNLMNSAFQFSEVTEQHCNISHDRSAAKSFEPAFSGETRSRFQRN